MDTISYFVRLTCFFQSRDLDTKQVWLLELKKRLLDSYAAAVPMKVRMLDCLLSIKRKDES